MTPVPNKASTHVLWIVEPVSLPSAERTSKRVAVSRPFPITGESRQTGSASSHHSNRPVSCVADVFVVSWPLSTKSWAGPSETTPVASPVMTTTMASAAMAFFLSRMTASSPPNRTAM
jgi:hypothetical protein